MGVRNENEHCAKAEKSEREHVVWWACRMWDCVRSYLRRTAWFRQAKKGVARTGAVGLLAVATALALIPTYAYAAAPQVIISDSVVTKPNDNTVYTGYMVMAYNKFDAALLTLGISTTDSRLNSNGVRAKLSNAGTGGAFYTYTQEFFNNNDNLTPPSWAAGLDGSFAIIWENIALENHMDIWYCATTDAQMASAKEDLLAVLGGAELGGGGSVPSEIPITYTSADCTMHKLGTFNPLSQPITITLSSSFLSTAQSYFSRYGPYYAYRFSQRCSLPSDGSTNFEIYFSSHPIEIIELTSGGKVTQIRFKSDSTLQSIYSNYVSKTSGSITLNGANYNGTSTVNVSSNGYAQSGAIATDNQYIGWTNIGGQSSPVLPPNNWPENPTVTPTPLPEPPSDNPVYPPQVTEPDVTVPQTPDLSDILDALNEHCIHLQNAIYNGFDDYYTTITDYYDDVVAWLQEWLEYYDGVLDDVFGDITAYQRTANLWLNQIYNKLDDIDDKLEGLGEKITENDIPSSYDSSNVATDGSNVLASAYNGIRNKFPFSLLDSLATFAGSLVHTPVAPHFDMPVGNPLGNHEPYTVEIDLSAYSDWASIIRTGEIVLVYIALARRAAVMWTGEGVAK